MSRSLEYTTLNLGELQTNCYITWCPQTRTALVIDPADSGDTISQFILENQLELTAIVLTHGHFDHCLGLLELSLNFTVPIYMHPKDLFLVKQAAESAEHWLKHSVDPVPLPTDELHEGAEIGFGNCSLTVLETPGHTPGSVSLYQKPVKAVENIAGNLYSIAPIIFSGDTLFRDGFGRTDFRYSSVLQLHDSLERLKQLSPDSLVLSGHGEPFELSDCIYQKT